MLGRSGFRLALVVAALATAGCEGEAVVIGQASDSLTMAQCSYFADGERVTICHRTGSARRPYIILTAGLEACVDHSRHAEDYIAFGDPTCSGQGCLPEGAPWDPTVECCAGFAPVDGTCQPVCGDGITAGVEQCDDGNLVDTDNCRADCTPARCGDGVVDTAAPGLEQCDDGNAASGDGCSATCATEAVGDPCITADGRWVCAAVFDRGVAYSGLPVVDDNGVVYLAGRNVPVNYGAPLGDLRRVHRTVALRSSDLGVVWGPQTLHPSCATNTGDSAAYSALSDAHRRLFQHGDWNDGSSDFCASIFARNLVDGSLAWATQPGGPHPRHDIALSPDRAFYGGWNGVVRSFNLVTGAIDATYDLDIPNVGSAPGGSIALATNGDVLIGQNLNVISRWTAAGVRRWQTPAVKSPFDLTDGDNLVGWSGGYGRLVYVDGGTGLERWSRALAGGPRTTLTDANGNLYVGHAGTASSFDPAGNLRWSTALDGLGDAQFLGSDGRFYVRTAQTLYDLGTSDGAVAWRFAVTAGVVSVEGQNVANAFSNTAVVLAGGDLLISDFAGRLYRLRTPGLDYAVGAWTRPRGNRRATGRVWEHVPTPPSP